MAAFEVHHPKQGPHETPLPLLANSPHAGRHYLTSFLESSRLDKHEIRRSEDAYLDLLLDDIHRFGLTYMKANFPRAYLDLNREPYELDPKMFEGKLPNYINSRSLRVAGGLGTIARIASEGREIYRQRLPAAEALHRVESLYKPYHRQLRTCLGDIQRQFGYAILFDWHSMPSIPNSKEANAKRPDFVIGDRFGSSCAGRLSDLVVSLLRNKGYTVAQNKPYAGGFITEHYGRREKGLHAIQIEINRALYMDEQSIRPHNGIVELKYNVNCVLLELAQQISWGEGSQIAAE
ncbi:N-formylglutamate amidohydrolase [Pseudovibrio hongkongensis]|uniref:N-formylglutamate amidohydrolase n=1 Tax=Polycladidibacter hongkongensis TaxID=1647556 RepID=UPI0009E892E2